MAALAAWIWANMAGNLLSSALSTAVVVVWHNRRQRRQIVAEIAAHLTDLTAHLEHDRDLEGGDGHGAAVDVR